MSTKIEFFVSNKDRKSYEDPLDWRVQFDNVIQELGAHTFNLQVDGCTFVNFIPTIMDNINDLFTYTYTNTLGQTTFHTLEVASGNYEVTDIVDLLTTELQLRNPGFDVVYDYVQYKLLITVPADTVLTLTRPANQATLSDTFRYENRVDRFLEVIGWSFINSISYPLPGGGAGFTWTPKNPTRLDGTSLLKICMDGNHSSFTSYATGNRPIGNYPVSGGYGSVVSEQNALEQTFTVSASAIQNGFRVYVVDEWGVNLGKLVPSNMFFHFRFSLEPTE